MGTAAAAAYEKGEIFESMDTRMEKLGYKLADTLEEDENAKKIGLRVQAWEGPKKIIIAVRGTDGSELYQNTVLSDFGGILFCALHDYNPAVRGHSRLRQHVQKMFRVFSDEKWGSRNEAFSNQDTMDAVVKFCKNYSVKNSELAAIFSNLESYVNQHGTKNLINSVILTLNFAAERVNRDDISRGKQIVFTGHSLGGFIASAAGRLSKAPTVAWNAPGGVGSFLDSKIEDIRAMRVGRTVYRENVPNFKPTAVQEAYHYYISRKHCPVASFGRHPVEQFNPESAANPDKGDIWVGDVNFILEQVDTDNGAPGFRNAYAKFAVEDHSIAILVWDLLSASPREQQERVKLELDRTNYQIGNPGTIALKDLTQLTKLNLTGNNLGDPGAAFLSGLTNLTDLNLSRNKLSILGFVSLSGLRKLQNLNLSDNEINTNAQDIYLSANERILSLTAALFGVAPVIAEAGIPVIGPPMAVGHLFMLLAYNGYLIIWPPEITAHVLRALFRDLGHPVRGLPALQNLDLSKNTIGRGAFILIPKLPNLNRMSLQQDTVLSGSQKQPDRAALRKKFQRCTFLFDD